MPRVCVCVQKHGRPEGRVKFEAGAGLDVTKTLNAGDGNTWYTQLQSLSLNLS